jgi:hypothetical protein
MKNNLVLTSIQEQINCDAQELLERKIEGFFCIKDSDVESFLKNNAVNYERIGLSRTYLYGQKGDGPFCLVNRLCRRTARRQT